MVTEIEEARTEIEKARQSLAEAKSTKAQREAEAEQVKQQLEEASSKLPNIQSQRSLRQRFSSLLGRQQRQTIKKVSGEIENKKAELGVYQQDLEKYGQDISNYETNVLNPYEQSVNQVQAENQTRQEEYNAEVFAYNQAQKFYQDRVPLGFVQGAEYKYLKQLYEAGTNYDEQKAIIETDLNNRLQQVNSGVSSFDQAFPSDYLKKLKRSGITITNPQNSDLQSLIPRLDRDVKKDIPKVPEFNITGMATGIGLVSAQQYQTLLPPVKQYSVIGLPQTFKEKLGKAIKEQGVFTGLRTTIGQELGGLVTRQELSQEKPYQPYAQGKAVNLVIQNAPYFTPIGAELLLVSGAERLLSPVGKREREQTQTSLQEKGFTPLISKVGSYAPPVIEIGLGAFGVKQKYSPYVSAQGENIVIGKPKPQTNFLGTIERVPEGSKIKVISRTSQGTENVFSTGMQLVNARGEKFANVGAGYTFGLESQRSLRQPLAQPKFIDIEKFTSLGTGQVGKGYAVKDYGNVLKVRGEFGEGYLIKNRVYTYDTSGKLVPQRETSGFITRKIADENPFNLFLGGEPKMRINKKTGQVTYVIRNPNIRGRLYEYNPLEVPDVLVKSPNPNIKKTPLSLTFQEQKAVSSLASSMKTAGEKKIKSVLESVEEPSRSLYPVSQYTGTGQYERTEEYGSLFQPSTKQSQTDILGFNQRAEVGNILGFKTSQEQGLKVQEKQKSRVFEGQLFKEFQGQVQPVRQTALEFLKDLSQQRQEQKLNQRQTQRQILGQAITQPTRETPPKKPVPFLFKNPEPSKSKSSYKNVLEDLYGVYTRTKGKDVLRGEFEDFGKAKEELFGKIRGELRASGFITKSGKPIRLNIFGTEFRPSKKDSFRIVEPKRRRIKKGTREVAEIQFLRGKRNKSMWGF